MYHQKVVTLITTHGKMYLIQLAINHGYGHECINTTFNNISVIWWQSVLLVEGTGSGIPIETTNLLQATDKLCLIKLYQIHLAMCGNQSHNFSG
jgi:hypothetical protein